MTKVKHPKLKNPIEKQFNEITRYHVFVFFIIFASKLPTTWHILSLIFLSPPMDYYCANDSSNDTKNACPCDEVIWDRKVFSQTVQTKFGIYCEKTWLISFSESMAYVGLLVGSLLFGFLSDRYGRLSMFSICCLVLAVAGCCVSAMPTITLFIITRVIEGIGSGGSMVTAFVLCIEYCGVRHRETVTALFHIPVNLGHITLAGMSYALRDCDEFQLALSIPIFFLVATRWIIMESPKWLLDNDHCEETIAVMQRFCRLSSFDDVKKDIEAFHAAQLNKKGHHLKFYEIFKYKKLFLNLACMSVVYFVCGMGYYGVSQYIGKMSGAIHTNVAISGLLLLPGTIISIFLLKYLTRRTFLMSTNFLSGVFMFIVISFPKKYLWYRVIFACFCNMFFFMSFIIVFLYGVELFPTSVRNSVLGYLCFLSRAGQIAAPQINAYSGLIAGAVFGGLAILGAVMTYPLPETKNTELPSDLEDSYTLTRKTVRLEEDPGLKYIPPKAHTSTQE